MILKIDRLTSAQFASLAAFLASDENMFTGSGTPRMFAEILSSKKGERIDQYEHDVVLELMETFDWMEPEEDKRKRSPLSCSLVEERRVPACCLLRLVQAMERYPSQEV